jgi:hypothetical protein
MQRHHVTGRCSSSGKSTQFPPFPHSFLNQILFWRVKVSIIRSADGSPMIPYLIRKGIFKVPNEKFAYDLLYRGSLFSQEQGRLKRRIRLLDHLYNHKRNSNPKSPFSRSPGLYPPLTSRPLPSAIQLRTSTLCTL